MSGTISNITVVENFASAIMDKRQIIKPYTDFPADPVIIFCGGIANIRKMSNPPTTKIDIVEAKSELNLTPSMNIRRKIIKELASIIPGDPAVHLKAFMQTIIHITRKRSPGKTKDCCIPRNEKFHVYMSKLVFPNERFVRFMTEKAMIIADINW